MRYTLNFEVKYINGIIIKQLVEILITPHLFLDKLDVNNICSFPLPEVRELLEKCK